MLVIDVNRSPEITDGDGRQFNALPIYKAEGADGSLSLGRHPEDPLSAPTVKTKHCSDQNKSEFLPSIISLLWVFLFFFKRLGKRDVLGLSKGEWSKAQRDP